MADGRTIGISVGVSDRTAGTPMKPTDRLLLGSVGKTYASAVALQMIAEGKYAVNPKIDRNVGGHPVNALEHARRGKLLN